MEARSPLPMRHDHVILRRSLLLHFLLQFPLLLHILYGIAVVVVHVARLPLSIEQRLAFYFFLESAGNFFRVGRAQNFVFTRRFDQRGTFS